MFFKGLSAGNFCTMAEQAGLCNICTEYGAENFVSLLSLLENLCLNGIISVAENLNFSKRINELKGYLRSEYSGNLQEHSNCAAHCMKLLLSDQEKAECTEEHQLNCEKCVERFNIISEIRAILEKFNKTDKDCCVKQIEQIESNLSTCVGHLVRGKYQRMKFTKNVQNLQTHQVVAVADYMMKLLFQKLFEPRRDLFAKKGVSVHGTMFLYKNENNRILTEFHDLYSEEDDRQNCFFFQFPVLRSLSGTLKLCTQPSVKQLFGRTMGHIIKILLLSHGCQKLKNQQVLNSPVIDILSLKWAKPSLMGIMPQLNFL